LGALNIEDVSPDLKRLEKLHGIDFSKMKPKTWLYNGELFTSPTFTQNGKPYQINQTIKQAWLNSLPHKETLSQKIAKWLKPKQQHAETANNEESEDNIKADSQGDGLFLNDDLFPEEF
jgi:hypothetical protein